jgi:hypothetical protein
MSKIIRQGPPEPDPIGELKDDIDSLRGEVATLQSTIDADRQWIKDALSEILRELQMKSDRDD